jgi:hypothetical protein
VDSAKALNPRNFAKSEAENRIRSWKLSKALKSPASALRSQFFFEITFFTVVLSIFFRNREIRSWKPYRGINTKCFALMRTFRLWIRQNRWIREILPNPKPKTESAAENFKMESPASALRSRIFFENREIRSWKWNHPRELCAHEDFLAADLAKTAESAKFAKSEAENRIRSWKLQNGITCERFALAKFFRKSRNPQLKVESPARAWRSWGFSAADLAKTAESANVAQSKAENRIRSWKPWNAITCERFALANFCRLWIWPKPKPKFKSTPENLQVESKTFSCIGFGKIQSWNSNPQLKTLKSSPGVYCTWELFWLWKSESAAENL